MRITTCNHCASHATARRQQYMMEDSMVGGVEPLQVLSANRVANIAFLFPKHGGLEAVSEGYRTWETTDQGENRIRCG